MIRKMRGEDLTRVLEIENNSFLRPWSREEYEYELYGNPFSHLFVIEVDGEIAGMMDIWVTFEIAQLANIAVSEAYRRAHLGSLMMEFLIDFCNQKMCETISLEVRVSNEKAIAMYEKYDFIQVNTRKQYYEDGEDAYLMVKALGGAYV